MQSKTLLKRETLSILIFSLVMTMGLTVLPQSAAATSSVAVGNNSVTVTPAAAAGSGTVGDPLIYSESISFGVQVTWSFEAPSALQACQIQGGHFSLTNPLNAATSSANVCRVTGTINSDQAAGELLVTLNWGSGADESTTIHTAFQREFDYGSNAVSTSMILTGTSGMEIGSTISIATPTVWKNPFLNTNLAPTEFYGAAFISGAKCGEPNFSYARVSFNNNDWNFAGNGFQIPASAVDVVNGAVADLTGYGVTFMLHPTVNNEMTDFVGPFKIGESTFVTCTHPSGGGGGGGGGFGGGFGQGGGSQAAAKYSGPEFSGLSAKPVAVGSSSVLEGKRLNEVSSITIGGKSATFTATATELKLDVPADLAPGTYDLVIHSAAGKLTQINALRVQGPRTSLSVTTISEGRISSQQLHEHALIAAMQQPELNKARCIVNGPNLAQAKAQAERLCALVRASNKNIETTVVESRSTVKNNKVYARVSYGWN